MWEIEVYPRLKNQNEGTANKWFFCFLFFPKSISFQWSSKYLVIQLTELLVACCKQSTKIVLSSDRFAMFSNKLLGTENHRCSFCGGIKTTFEYTCLKLWREVKAKKIDFGVIGIFVTIKVMFKAQMDCPQERFISS